MVKIDPLNLVGQPVVDPEGGRTEGGQEPRGPRGGNLHNPNQNGTARRADLQDPDGMHNSKGFKDTARAGLEKEQPWHLMAAYMLLAGRTNSEIAMAAGVLPVTVSILRAQNWFQQRLAVLTNADGQELLSSFKSHALASIERIAHIAEFGESERTRLAANTYIADQACGKAVQKTLNVNATAASGLSPQEEMAATMAQLADLRRARETSKPTLLAEQAQPADLQKIS